VRRQLLGIHRLDQLTELSMTPGGTGQQRLFGQNITKAVNDAVELRQRLRGMQIRDIHDVEAMARLDADARVRLEVPERIADAFIAEVIVAKGSASTLEAGLSSLSHLAEEIVNGNPDARKAVTDRTSLEISGEVFNVRRQRRPFHWPLEFPEVFSSERMGFDSIIGNPPFLGGKKITGVLGSDYREYLISSIASGKMAALILWHFSFCDASRFLAIKVTLD